MKKDSLLKSSFWISASGFISRFLAVVYIIPWNIWIGAANKDFANATYARVYNIYNLFLIIATAGIPSAISKEVAASNSIGQFQQSEKIFKRYSLYMTLIGVIIAAVMFFGADWVAFIFAAGDKRVITPIRYLSIAMLVIPALGILRGYIQGYAFISVSAFSQVIEQIARVAYMLYATYMIMIVQNGNYLQAVNQSTLASFIGATSAYIFLLWKRRQIRKSEKDIIIENPDPKTLPGNINLGTMFKSAIPFLLVDTIMAFLQLFDQISFTLIYRNILHQSQTVIDTLFGMFGFQANKLIMVIVALAISVSASVIPALSSMISRRAENSKIRTLLKNIIEFTFFIILPATLGMIAISSPLWTLFNNQSRIGTQLLIVSCLEAFTYSFFMILENILQVTGHVKTSLWYLLWAYMIKIILQTPMTVMFGGFGPLVASTIAFLIMGYLAFRIINIQFHLIDRFIVKNVLKMSLDSSVMLIIVGIAVWLLSKVIPDNHKIGATIVMSLGVIIGVIIYGALSYFDGSLKILKKIKNTEIY